MGKDRIDDLHLLPKVRDSWGSLYIEHARVEKNDNGVSFIDESGRTAIPAASLMVLMLGPGSTISHAAVRSLAETGCLVVWTGEQAVRFYATGVGETRSARRLMHQARLWADEATRMAVVRRMYVRRFSEPVDARLTLQQLRGMEGARVRDTYARFSRETGVPWAGRSYRQSAWKDTDPVNRALSCANGSLYGICHAAIVASGYATGLGFIHTGHILSFVYDIADLYKTAMTIPAAFEAAAEGDDDLERRVRIACRDYFHRNGLLRRIIADIDHVLDTPRGDADQSLDREMEATGGLWDPETGSVPGGVNYGADES
jgi:CRISPR-associated protein Cas1